MYMTKTRKMRSSNKSTRKNKSISSSSGSSMKHLEQEIVVKFLQILNMVKLYHWKTYSYATHKATDELYSKLNDHTDSFVEVLLGKHGDRLNLMHTKAITLKDFNSVSDFKREMINFKGFLVGLNSNNAMKGMSNSDLYNIRDEILGDVNQFLYLLTFK